MFNWESINNYLDNGTPAPPRKVEKSEEEWKKILTPAQFNVMRKKGTERPHTGELCSFYEAGRYACAGCDTELFDSNVKFDSGTGWPSFSEPVADNVIQYELDTTYGRRIEVLCVASRTIIRTLMKQAWLRIVPALHSLHWGFALQSRLG